jgi:phosphoribosyl 1,2-cyclic phosphodiesterase
MKIKFYGTRGSIAVPGRDYAEFGGNTTCVLVTFEHGGITILDAGTGIRNLGSDMIKAGFGQYDNIFILFSHTHWDHIQGFPFFGPAYDPKRKFTLVFPNRSQSAKNLQDIFSIQMQDEFFPVPLDKMGSKIEFMEPESTRQTGPRGVTVIPYKHNHPGGAYSYRFEEGNKSFVYCTDMEHGETIDPNIVELSKNADLLIHDAQYSQDELKIRKGWGHSSWDQSMEVAEQANVKKLVLTHHDPEHDDAYLRLVEKECKSQFANVILAREELEIEV